LEIHRDLPREGPGRDRYTERAYRMLPHMTSPRILDIGCGPDGPTMALARLSGGEVIGIDVHEQYLDLCFAKTPAAWTASRWWRRS